MEKSHEKDKTIEYINEKFFKKINARDKEQKQKIENKYENPNSNFIYKKPKIK